MSKRKKRISLYGVIEGDREQYFLAALVDIYQPRKNNISPKFDPSRGGSPDKIIRDVLKRLDRNRSFCWFDEDFEPKYPLSKDVRELLANAWDVSLDKRDEFLECPLKDLQSTFNKGNKKKPTLIISQPVCVESLVFTALGRVAPVQEYIHEERDNQIKSLKGALQSIVDASGLDEFNFYLNELDRDNLETIKLDSPELDLLIDMLIK